MANSKNREFWPLALLLLIAFYFWNKAKQTATAYAYSGPAKGSTAYTYNSAISSVTALAGALSALFKASGNSNVSAGSAGAPVASAGDGNDYSWYESEDLG